MIENYDFYLLNYYYIPSIVLGTLRTLYKILASQKPLLLVRLALSHFTSGEIEQIYLPEVIQLVKWKSQDLEPGHLPLSRTCSWRWFSI